MSGISVIVAVADNGVIGRGNTLPWHLPADLRRFRALTTGHAIIMGRRCFESIGKPLPGRHNIVLTRQRDYRAEGCTVVNSLEVALAAADTDSEPFVIGGAEIYRATLPIARRLYLTEVHAAVGGDTFFPAWDRGDWREMSREERPADADNAWPVTFRVMERAKT